MKRDKVYSSVLEYIIERESLPAEKRYHAGARKYPADYETPAGKLQPIIDALSYRLMIGNVEASFRICSLRLKEPSITHIGDFLATLEAIIEENSVQETVTECASRTTDMLMTIYHDGNWKLREHYMALFAKAEAIYRMGKSCAE